MAGSITPTPGVPFNLATYISAASMTGTATVSGPWVYVHDISVGLAFQAVWTGTPTGTFTVNVTQDANPANITVLGPTALTIPSSPSPNPAGSAGSFVFYLSGLTTPWVQLTYTNSTGSGTLNVGVSGK